MEKIQYFRIGKIVSTRGLKGEVKIYSYTDNIDRFKELNFVYLDKKEDEILEIQKMSPVSTNMVVLKFVGYDSIESVQKLINKSIYVDRENTYELDEDEILISDMIGMIVETVDGKIIGKLSDVLQYSANDVYVVKSEDSKEYLIPAVYEIVPEINEEENKIIINPISGLLD